MIEGGLTPKICHRLCTFEWPLPLPGPPITKTTSGFVAASAVSLRVMSSRSDGCPGRVRLAGTPGKPCRAQGHKSMAAEGLEDTGLMMKKGMEIDKDIAQLECT